jgi:hypothetical protein
VGDCLANPALVGTGGRAKPSSEALHDGTDPSWRARGDGYSPRGPRRLCGWCDGPIPPAARSDAVYCSTRCRQASHRFGKGRALRVAAGRPLRLAYADPPYPGKAGLYRGHPDFAGEVDPVALVERLVAEFTDGWALSTSAEALPAVLPSCPPAVRVAAWFRGERPTLSYRPLSSWEPVVYRGGRAYPSPLEARRLDALVHVARIRTTDPRRVVGAKPAAFCWWVFDLLGALPGDELVDLFPGSGGIGRAWRLYTSAGESRRNTNDQPMGAACG